MSVPQFGDWDQKGAMPDYSVDFSKIRENRKQNKRDISRASLGNEEELISNNRSDNDPHQLQLNDHPNLQNHSPTQLGMGLGFATMLDRAGNGFRWLRQSRSAGASATGGRVGRWKKWVTARRIAEGLWLRGNCRRDLRLRGICRGKIVESLQSSRTRAINKRSEYTR
ncbi:hypothetical protein HHK36_030600 [Tetracentron sinense]|uniref:RIN4 pathogenic type III effector avirulence factor Avr cleavage site domain-containing protein n=1 Tax=Tetracentron sinense TaxID=13715 RepID=A0A834Y804_TETSI|nr:hypothetical protein HHK36_030600 [Tetracentron sinense]